MSQWIYYLKFVINKNKSIFGVIEQMAEYINEIKIPMERIAVLIGKDGESKDMIEKITNTHLEIDSKEGDVIISGDDPITMFNCVEIVKAIGRGVNPEVAMRLKKLDYVLEIVSIADFAKTQNDMVRLKGRVIGKDGKSRRVMEDMLDINISVYGKTIAIVGRGEDVALARRAIESLLSGSPHSNVYKWLEKQRTMHRRRELKEGAF